MKLSHSLVLGITLILIACQPAAPATVTIIDNGKAQTLQTDENVPSVILTQAGINLGVNDRVLFNGMAVDPGLPIVTSPIILQIRRAVPLTIISPNGQQQFDSSASTVGEALKDAGISLQQNDTVDPPLETPINGPLTIQLVPSRELTITVDGKAMQVQSSARTVGEALAEAGIPLVGLDYSRPFENEALPEDGQIKVVRVNDSIVLVQKPIPFESELVASAEVPLDQTQILAPGENGLSVQRIRVRYEDGQEVSRVTEEETMVRPPKARTLAYGTKVDIKTAVVDGREIEYWRAVPMYATSYSPCRLGTSICGSTTASGKQLQKGIVALRTDLYHQLQGQLLYIPGYGYATVEDACGGCVGQPWIDLGFSDDDFEPWHQTVIVYFLTPVPQNIPYTLE
jgi:uncharacterized protein YabE (DUF348 family)